MGRLVFVGLLIFVAGAKGKSVQNILPFGNDDASSSDNAGDADFSTDIDDLEAAQTYESNESQRVNSVDLFPHFLDEKGEWQLIVGSHQNEDSSSLKEDPINSQSSQAAATPELMTAEEKNLEYFPSVEETGFGSSEENFQNSKLESGLSPIRRQINSWQGPHDFIEPANIPSIPETYHDHDDDPYRQHYFQKSNYQENLDRFKGYSYTDEYQTLKEDQHGPELPHYVQKNYYNNFYVMIPGGRQTVGWSASESFNSETDAKGRGNFREHKLMQKNDCKHYLQFVKHMFQKLDDDPYYYQDESEQYDRGITDQEKAPGQPPFQTHLLGPTLYVDNSGKASQSNLYGNSLQTIDGPLSGSKFTSVPPNDFRLYPSAVGGRDWKSLFPHRKNNVFEQSKNESRVSSTESTTAATEPKATEGPGREEETSSYNPEILRRFGGDHFQTTAAPDTEETYSTENFSHSEETYEKSEARTTTKKPEYHSPSAIFVGVPEPTHRPFAQRPMQPDSQITQTTMPSQNWMLHKEPEPDFVGDTPKADVDCNDKMLPCPDTVNVTYPLNGYCNRYVTCESGRAIRRTCSDGLHYNPITKSCDLPHNSICTYECQHPNGFYGIPGDCAGYFVCKNFNLEYRMCPPKMHWDTRKAKCIFEELSHCPMKCPMKNQIKEYEGDCRGYVICLQGIPYYHKCPPQTKFDRISQNCLPEHLSHCKSDPKLLTKTINPNVLCSNILSSFGTNKLCEHFPKNRNPVAPDVE